MPKVESVTENPDNIRKLLIKTHLDRAEIAEMFNITESAVSQYIVRGKIPKDVWEVIKRIANIDEDGQIEESDQDIIKDKFGERAYNAIEKYYELINQNSSIPLKQRHIKESSTEVLVKELDSRGWDVSLKKKR